MNSETLAHYLRSHRKRLGLTQDELGWLVGAADGAIVSKYENFEAQPSLKTALAFEAIFGVTVKEIFAGIFEAVEMLTSRRANELIKKLEQRHDPSAARLDTLRALARRGSKSQKTRSHA